MFIDRDNKRQGILEMIYSAANEGREIARLVEPVRVIDAGKVEMTAEEMVDFLKKGKLDVRHFDRMEL